MVRKILVIPNERIYQNNLLEKEWSKKFEFFWEFESSCVASIENEEKRHSYIHSKMFKRCSEVNWSTFYPDPKSDINLKIGLDLDNRNTSKMCKNNFDRNLLTQFI